MLTIRRLALCAAAIACVVPAAVTAQTDVFPAERGEIRITPFASASVQLEWLGAVIHVDPWGGRGDYSQAEQADVILVTDTSGDHLDPAQIAQLRTPSTTVILSSTPEEARDEAGANRLRQVQGAEVMNNDERRVIDLSSTGTPPITIESVAMYDIIPGQPFHAKGEGNGYIVTLGGVRIYLSGVTECTPEFQAVQDVDIAFVPMNLPNGRMPPSAAADCIKIIDPDVVYPYHYRERPIDVFIDALADESIDIRLHDWYPPA